MMEELDLTLTLGRTNEEKMTPEKKLPLEIIQEIISRLPISSVFQSRYVSESCRALINDPRTTTLHYHNHSLRNKNPSSLILQSGHSDLHSIPDFDTCESGAIKLTKLPFKSWLPRFRIVGSVNGFICLADLSGNYRSVFICNPVKGDWFLLPDAPVYGRVKNFAVMFGYSSKHKQYKVLRWRSDQARRVHTVEIITLGSNTWTTLATVPWTNVVHSITSQRRSLRPSFGVIVEDRLHYITLDGVKGFYITSFGFEDEKFGTIFLPDSIKQTINHGVFNLAVLQGCLVVSGLSENGLLEVWVMKHYGVEESWIWDFSIPMPNNIRFAQPMGVQKNGKIVLEVDGTALYTYNPEDDALEKLQVSGLPQVFWSVPLVGTLTTVQDAIAMPNL